MSKSSITSSLRSDVLDSDEESTYKRRLRRRKAKYQPSLWDRYYDSWYPEVAAICLSTICGIAIVAVLKTYDQKSPPNLRYGFTLNAIISILATTAKVAMIFSISSALGQLKWVWFNSNQSRQLLDAEIFDEASRGPWGSIRLLSTHVAWSLAAFGSVLTIMALGFDPFVQQVISYPIVVRNETSDRAVVPVAKSLFDMPKDPRSIRVSSSAIERGFFNNLDFQLSPNCPSGNCTFEHVPSIGWCSQCVEDSTWSLAGNCNVTVSMDELEEEGGVLARDCKIISSVSGRPELDLSLAITYPDLKSLNATPGGGQMKLSWLKNHITNTSSIVDYLQSLSSPASLPPDQPILEVTYFAAAPDLYSRYLSLDIQKCSFDTCVSYSDVNVSSNIITTKVTNHTYGRKLFQNGSRYGTPYSEFLCWTPNDKVVLDIGKSEYDEDSVTVFSSQDYSFCRAQNSTVSWFKTWALELGSMLTGSTTAQYTRQIRVKSGVMINDLLAPSDVNTTHTGGAIMQAVGTDDIGNIFGNISTSLNLLTLQQSTSWNVTGKMETRPTVVSVRAWWLIVPFILYIGTIGFLGSVIYLNSISKAPLWKSSINVLFYHGLDHDMGLHSSLTTVPEMEARSTQMNARLVPFGRHDRLVLETTMIRDATWTNFVYEKPKSRSSVSSID